MAVPLPLEPRDRSDREGIQTRAPISAELTACQRYVLGATCFLGVAPAADLATVTGLSVHVVRRALADLRELRLVVAERQRGTGTGNVWRATDAR